MDLQKSVVLINSSEIINIVRNALGKIDPRLVDHGERVGYIAKMIYDESENKSQLDLSKLYVLCVLHDIGAYKTDEIDDMVRFETEKPLSHSLYGYLFLKNTTHLHEYAEAVLYHHTDYSELIKTDCKYKDYAEIIHIADRTDIILNSKDRNPDKITQFSGTRFSPEYVKALFDSEMKNHFFDKISEDCIGKETKSIIDSLTIDNSEIIDYLKLLVYAIDFRSPYTVTHTADTALISLETGKLLGLSEHDMDVLYLGSFLHDIGKIAIPHSILDKPGRLTPEELDIIKTHIPEGEQILRGVVSDEICNIAVHHHEKLDGSGYSHGIKSDELTLPERIVAVADIVSALSQRRSYKEPFPKEKVISIITEMKDDGLLCGKVVDTIVDNYDLILTNTSKSHDPVKSMYDNLLKAFKERSAEFSRQTVKLLAT